MKIKERIKQWLLKEEIEEIKHIKYSIERMYLLHDNSILNYNKAITACEKSTTINKELRQIVDKMIDVGVDVGFRSDNHSWAVVCL